MRFYFAFAGAVVMAFFVFWVGAQLAGIISAPHDLPNEFTRGRKMMLCGRVIDTRHEVSGYDLERWLDRSTCDDLSRLEECLLDCLSQAGTVAMGDACYADCVEERRDYTPAPR